MENLKLRKQDQYKRFFHLIGALLILFSLLLNPFSIAQIYSSDHTITSTKFLVLILIFELLLFLLGIVLLTKKEWILSKRRELFLLSLSLLFSILLIEIGARYAFCTYGTSLLQTKYLAYEDCEEKSIYQPHHYILYKGTSNYISNDGKNIHNSYGYRGEEVTIPKPEHIYRIIILGGSTTYTTCVSDWQNSFPALLEKHLREIYNTTSIEVVNAGLGGWTTWESLIDLELNGLELEPNMILFYHSVNDAHARLVNPAYYKRDNSGYRSVWTSENKKYLLFKSIFVRLITGFNPWNLRFMTQNHETSIAGKLPDIFNPLLNGTPSETFQKNKPIYFKDNIRLFYAISKEFNITLVLSTWASSNGYDDYMNTSYYQDAIREQNDIVKDFARENGISFYDLAFHMPSDRKYWCDNRHVTEEGADFKAFLFAEYLKDNDIIELQ